MIKGKRGRPFGYRLPEKSKRSISESKKGHLHKQETKDKISRSLLLYFKQFNSLADEIINKYCKIINDVEVVDWVDRTRERIDRSDNILTEKKMWNIQKTELSCGHDIERFGHGLTPEFLVLFKEMVEGSEYGKKEKKDNKKVR